MPVFDLKSRKAEYFVVHLVNYFENVTNASINSVSQKYFNWNHRLGCDRLLTSGQGASALDGSDFLRQLIQQNPEMEIVPGGGITENNLVCNSIIFLDRIVICFIFCIIRGALVFFAECKWG